MKVSTKLFNILLSTLAGLLFIISCNSAIKKKVRGNNLHIITLESVEHARYLLLKGVPTAHTDLGVIQYIFLDEGR